MKFEEELGNLSQLMRDAKNLYVSSEDCCCCFIVFSSCACLMRLLSQGTKPYLAHYLKGVVFCMHMYSLAGLIRRTPLPLLSDTAIIDRHSDTTFSSSEHLGVDILVYWIRKIVWTCTAGGGLTELQIEGVFAFLTQRKWAKTPTAGFQVAPKFLKNPSF